MRSIDVLNLSVRQMQMFIAVGKYSSITQAAEYLHTSKSAVSKNIRQMEHELDLILFIRANNRLRLTPAGKTMWEEFSSISSQIENALIKAQSSQVAQTRPVIVGIPSYSEHVNHITPTLEALRMATPAFDYYIECYDFEELTRQLLNHEVDVLFTGLFEESTLKGLNFKYRVIERFPLAATMTAGNPLASKEMLSMDDVRSERIVAISPVSLPSYMRNMVLPLFESSPSQPKISYYASTTESSLANLHDDDELVIVDEFISQGPLENQATRTIKGSESGIVMAWLPESDVAMSRTIGMLLQRFGG